MELLTCTQVAESLQLMFPRTWLGLEEFGSHGAVALGAGVVPTGADVVPTGADVVPAGAETPYTSS